MAGYSLKTLKKESTIIRSHNSGLFFENVLKEYQVISGDISYIFLSKTVRLASIYCDFSLCFQNIRKTNLNLLQNIKLS